MSNLKIKICTSFDLTTLYFLAAKDERDRE
jgi:hypothetical protein